jgi:16S rRNA (cytosine967-C5)-methyltransferase
LDRAFGAVAGELEPRDRAFAHELAYGATRLRGRLDHLIGRHVHRGLSSLDGTVLEVLRLGAYQLLYMDGVPAFAAVSEAVEQVREEVGRGPAGLVNAVLRRVADSGDGPQLFPDRDAEPGAFLTTWGSHPAWLVERWLTRWDLEQVEALIAANNARPPIFLVALDVGPAAAAELLCGAGIDARPEGGGTRCVRLAPGTSPANALRALPHAIIQDPAANLVAAYADVPDGMKVADVCAAPGGKVLAVSERSVYTLAADRSEARIHMTRENARRAGRSLAFVVADARHPTFRDMDVVLLDVPCSGTGTLARHPDARWRLRPESIAELAALQAGMLEAAAAATAPGGLLVYSTCSLEQEENEARIDAFLEVHRDFGIEESGATPDRYVVSPGLLSVTPQEHGYDGAFAARMRRAA